MSISLFFVAKPHRRLLTPDGLQAPSLYAIEKEESKKGIECIQLDKPPFVIPYKKFFLKNNIWLILTLSCYLKRFLKKHLGFTVFDNDKDFYEAYLSILKLIKPKKVFVNYPPKHLIYACFDLKIKLYEVQHGIIHKNNNFYLINKERFRKYGINFICNEKSSLILNKNFGVKKKHIKVRSTSYLEGSKYIYIRKSKAHKLRGKYKKILCYTLQCHMEKNSKETPVMSENYDVKGSLFPVWFEKIIKENKDIKFLFKLHPLQTSSKIRVLDILYLLFIEVKYKNLKIVWDKRLSSTYLIDISDVHLSYGSSLARYAFENKKHTIFLCPYFGSNKNFINTLVEKSCEKVTLNKSPWEYESLNKKIREILL